MNKVRIIHYPKSTDFSVGELVDIGRRLTETQLKNMRLLPNVKKSEEENVWRLKAVIELLKPLTHIFPKVSKILLSELEKAESQLVNPVRGQAREIGGTPRSEGRQLPRPGAILIRTPKYRSFLYPSSDTFKFLVVKQPSKLLRLNDPGGPIYRNPSKAARDAIGHRVNGWDFFEIK